ncbi:MAG: serine hydrolase, partial [Ruminococcus sp.]|nr:serine hydrolase [Ruminococcus sp.]
YVQDLSTGKELIINNRKVYAASEIKLFAMAAAYQQVEDGKLALVSVEDDVEVMISESDNYTFNSILKKIGLGEINKWCEANGYTETEQHHALAPASNYSDDLKNGKGENKTSAHDIGTLLASIYRGECVSKDCSEKMLTALLDQQKRDKIPAGLPKVTRVANKTGETSDENHDAAIVYSPGGDYVLVITAVIPELAWGMNETLAEVSETVYDFFNNIPYPELATDSVEEE